MKKRVIFLLTGLFIWTSVLLAQNVPEGVIGAFKEGNSQELNKYLGAVSYTHLRAHET